jgi:hypothetical protein
MKRAWTSILLCAALAATPRPASAQQSAENAAAAQALFDSAMELIKAGKHVEACPKLAESHRLDPAPGTEFRLAECYERTGRIASAWTHFVAVADASQRSSQRTREKVARERAEALRVRLPKISIAVSDEVARVDGLEVKRDGVVVGRASWNVGLPVDPGDHTIEATAPGKQPFQKSAEAVEGKTVEVTIPELEAAPSLPGESVSKPPADASARPPVDQEQKPDESGSGTGRVVAILASGVVGLAGVAVGSVFGAKGFSTWDEALSHCQGGALKKCDSTGIQLEADARTAATISTVGFIAGGAGLAAAGILWLTAPSSPSSSRGASSPSAKRSGLQVAPVFDQDHLGGVVRGTF